ncbi:unnamed protein product [Caenorhabditis nigoni]
MLPDKEDHCRRFDDSQNGKRIHQRCHGAMHFRTETIRSFWPTRRPSRHPGTEKVRADIFVPKLQPGRLLPGILKHGKLAVLKRTRRQAMDRPVQPFLYNWRNLTELENEQMNWDSLPFVKFELHADF